MSRNPSMTEEDWRWFELWRAAPGLSETEIDSLEKQLQIDQSDMDARFQLFGYYNKYQGNKLEQKNAEQKLFEIVLWIIENKPALEGFPGTRLMKSGNAFKPKTFGVLRQAWLEQVLAFPMDGTVLGNAALFISWNDYETSSELIERAYALQPTQHWLGTFVISVYFEMRRSPNLYKNKIREHIIDVGIRSLKTEPGYFLTACEFVSEAALDLERLETVRFCIEKIRTRGTAESNEMANAYEGLVALRENDLDVAIKLMLKMKPESYATALAFRFANELFDWGERESIVQFIKNLKGTFKASNRNRWLEQIANDERPDFKKNS